MRVRQVRVGNFRPLSRRISVTVQKKRQRLLLISNRKSNTRFRLVPKLATLVDPEMTLDGNYALRVSEPTTKVCMKTDPYYQPQKCSPVILSFYQNKFYADIRRDSLERGRQMRVGWSKMEIFASFARYIFRTFTFKAAIIILCHVALQWLFIDTETDDFEWLFFVKIWFELGIQWVGVLAFGENCQEIC